MIVPHRYTKNDLVAMHAAGATRFGDAWYIENRQAIATARKYGLDVQVYAEMLTEFVWAICEARAGTPTP